MRTHFAERLLLIKKERSESGSAMVASIGVMIICVSLGVLVITQAISSQRDSGRNRARTVEIHSAEGGVDTLHATLQQGQFVCNWSTTDGDALGPDAVGAKAEISYWDAAGNALDCDHTDLEATVDGEPGRARILVTAKNQKASGAGLEPVRSFESEVLLSPVKDPSRSAALFSEGNVTLSNMVNVFGDGDVWVDSGDLHVSAGQFNINGSVYVPEGKVTFPTGGNIAGSLYSGEKVHSSSYLTVGGNVNVKNGDFQVQTPPAHHVGGDVRLGGQLVIPNGFTAEQMIDGSLIEGHTFNKFPEARGLPPVEYEPNDWYDSGNWNESSEVFQPWPGKSEADAWLDETYKNGLRNAEAAGDWPLPALGQCPTWGAWNGTYGREIRLPAVDDASAETQPPRIYDARGCQFNPQDTTFKLYGDTAIFAKGFNLTSGVNIESGNGETHRLWLIAPHEHDNSQFIAANELKPDTIEMFVYVNGTLNVSSGMALTGHLYAKNYNPSNDVDITPGGFGIPGVDLMPGIVDVDASWNVDVIYKRETSERVEVN